MKIKASNNYPPVWLTRGNEKSTPNKYWLLNDRGSGVGNYSFSFCRFNCLLPVKDTITETTKRKESRWVISLHSHLCHSLPVVPPSPSLFSSSSLRTNNLMLLLNGLSSADWLKHRQGRSEKGSTAASSLAVVDASGRGQKDMRGKRGKLLLILATV